MENQTVHRLRDEVLKWFIWAIYNKLVLKIAFYCNSQKEVITRRCIPFDYGPSRRYKDKTKRYYHVLDLDSSAGHHPLAILPENIIELEILKEEFDPKDFVHWTPQWIVPRDWGIYS